MKNILIRVFCLLYSLLKHLIFSFIIFPFFTNSFSLAQNPEKVYRYCYTQESREWYEEQAELWKAELALKPESTDAWYNYFFATRYANFSMDGKERTKLLNSIIDDISKTIPNSYLHHYLEYYNGDRKVEYLEKALQINPNCADLYWEFIQYYELNGMPDQKKEFCEKLYLSNDIISSLYDYNFNMLNSADKNSILFTNGDNDNYPAWVLQEAKGIRTDVTILNAHTVFVLRDYLVLKLKQREIEINLDKLSTEDNAIFLRELMSAIKNKYPEISIHIAMTVYDGYTKEIKDKLYVTGLVYTYSDESIDNISIIKRNLEQNLRLDYLDYDWYNEPHISTKMMGRYNLNYIPAFIQLAKAYRSSDQLELFYYWQEKALLIAQKAKDESLIEEIKTLK
jgi:hypothetical protein